VTWAPFCVLCAAADYDGTLATHLVLEAAERGATLDAMKRAMCFVHRRHFASYYPEGFEPEPEPVTSVNGVTVLHADCAICCAQAADADGYESALVLLLAFAHDGITAEDAARDLCAAHQATRRALGPTSVHHCKTHLAEDDSRVGREIFALARGYAYGAHGQPPSLALLDRIRGEFRFLFTRRPPSMLSRRAIRLLRRDPDPRVDLPNAVLPCTGPGCLICRVVAEHELRHLELARWTDDGGPSPADDVAGELEQRDKNAAEHQRVADALDLPVR
jgi:hypothetical protein